MLFSPISHSIYMRCFKPKRHFHHLSFNLHPYFKSHVIHFDVLCIRYELYIQLYDNDLPLVILSRCVCLLFVLFSNAILHMSLISQSGCWSLSSLSRVVHFSYRVLLDGRHHFNGIVSRFKVRKHI